MFVGNGSVDGDEDGFDVKSVGGLEERDGFLVFGVDVELEEEGVC